MTEHHEAIADSFDTDQPRDPEWYKRAVFYEVLIRGFQDANGDGTGDLPGLISKLDYLEWLGIDCLWLLPIYQSPLRDGGYDISDFMAVLPEYGHIGDFVTLVDEAHKRGIRVIADLVMNHTSDQHPWFQASRSDPDGPYGDFYVWSDTDDKYSGARVIFVDTEASNWTFDPVRGQYYWHRFFSHQPDLNFENPRVQDAMIEVLRFWLDLGIDGFRLDAVPYLYEREGTNCENLKETHEYLKRIRTEIDKLYPDKVLLAEANQWPADVIEYFGDPSVGGDECHMAFHFPLMPRIFMAVRREQRYPISEILAQTPQIPAGCQWGIFLRNHDELTLEMVTDDERDYMYAEYAKDPRMKANIGIRRRLAPLLDGDRNQLELFTALLLSLPGSPVLYYGDEIGMGDNIWLGDRDGVRTPMQWTPDRNGGFSQTDPQRLYLPPIMDALYGYQALNVEAQQRNPASFLQWTRRMIEIRKRHPVFGTGIYEELTSSNPSVLAFVRLPPRRTLIPTASDRILCVNNLSRFPQPVELDLRRFIGVTPVESMGGVTFPRIGELSYLLTLPGHGFYWFQLPRRPRGTASLQAGVGRPPAVSRLTPTSPGKGRLMAFEDVLAAWLVKQRWFAGKGRTVHDLAVVADTEIIPGDPGLRHLLVTVSHGATSDCYQLFVGLRARLPARLRHARIGTYDGQQVYDGLHDSDLTRALLDAIVAGRTVGALRFCRIPEAELSWALGARVRAWTAWCSPASRATPAWCSASRPSSRCSAGSPRARTRIWRWPRPWPSSARRTSRSPTAGSRPGWTARPPCSPSCPATCAPPRTAGRWPRRASVTCTRCTQTAVRRLVLRARPAATSRGRRNGSASRPRRCTRTWRRPSVALISNRRRSASWPSRCSGGSTWPSRPSRSWPATPT